MNLSQPREDTFGQFNLDTIDRHFPKDAYRDGQKECIEFALNAFNDGKKVVILECPTGSGKSAIGMTIADMVPRSYYLTVTKILQDQLVDDFSGEITELRGRASYPCTYWDRYGQKLVSRKLVSAGELKNKREKFDNCASGFCRTKLCGDNKKFKCTQCFTTDGPVHGGQLSRLSGGKAYSECPYYEQVYQAINNRKVVMNFSSFLFQTQMTKRFDVPRNLMIIDEAHNVEPQLLDFVSLSINDYYLQDYGIFIPEFNSPYEYAMWFEDSKIYQSIFQIMKDAENREDNKLVDEMARLFKKYELFMKQVKKAKDGFDWVCEYEEKTSGKQFRKITLRPVFAVDFAQPLLFGYADKILMMSATILDVNIICRSLGLDKKHVAAYRMKNRFPVENRPIYLDTVGKMTGGKQRMHEWAPAMVRKVQEIADKYPDDKGIIHTHNFAIMDYILKHVNLKTKSRLLNQRDFANKHEMMKAHIEADNTILIAPAMHEGIDLKEDLSRFQIICKVPYPNCFDDKQLARRVEVDRRYYMWLTALKVIQSYGRSIRSEDDYADTYILDESIHRFLQNTKSMIPSWFKEAIK